ncbi:WD repeat-containing protein 41 isoform X2 [Kryptolebias marmoratus]|uniref:WD repeat-containing protein 41 isoform X2 n=1 Tax=Kryptolebias marmoratus TaxID=37003 RepID=UPI0018ACADA9|nr:WD repeat-containing protein 41 isoform X2 [Kryptolebias marmoratus]
MLRWILGGREAQSCLEKSPVLCIGEEQPKNCFTELQVLKGHFDIVRFLVQIDDFRCASAGDDGLVLVWNIETGERLQELRGHSQQITAITTFTCSDEVTSHTSLITASSDRSLSLWDPDSGNRVQSISDLQSSVKCLLVLEHLSLWVSGGEELCLWSKDFEPQCHLEKASDTGVTALIELPKNCLAAAVDRKIVIYRLTASADSSVSMDELQQLSEHQDQIRALINVNDGLFASGSHAGELILWDSISWNNLAYEHILWEESKASTQTEIRLGAPKPSEMSIQHLSTNGNLVLAAVGCGLYVYDVGSRSVVAYRRAAHDSDILHTMLLSDSELMSCSEDGSVKMWEIQDLPLPAEPASAGFFGMWTFGRSGKQSGPQAKKVLDIPNLRTLELTGDLIGHSGAVQMFLSFKERGLVTCSTDHLLILWKNGERQSRLRSLALFHKLEENGGL